MLLGPVALALPAAVSADHCGAAATISPSSGPPGTTFVFRTNLGAPSDLRLYRNDRLVAEQFLDGEAFVQYDITTESGDEGRWRARAEVRGQPECAAEASFVVLGAPDTSTASTPSTASSTVVPAVVLALLAGFGLGLRRSPRGFR
jgi:hypothetical protein